MKRPPVTDTTLVLTLTQAERSALLQVLEAPFCGDADDLAAVVGPGNLRAARAMVKKILAELERTRRMGMAP